MQLSLRKFGIQNLKITALLQVTKLSPSSVLVQLDGAFLLKSDGMRCFQRDMAVIENLRSAVAHTTFNNLRISTLKKILTT